MLATEVHRRLISDCNGRDPRSGAAPRSGASTLDGGTTPALASRPPVPGGFPAVVPRFAPSCVGADCGDPFTGVDPPGFWVVLQKNGPEFDVIPEFWAVVSVPRRDSRRWLRYNPRSEAFTSSMSRSAAYETAQNSARTFRQQAGPSAVQAYETAQNFARAFQVTNQPLSQAAYETAQRFARALCRTLDRAKNGEMGLRNRPGLCSGVRPPSAG